MRQNPVGEPAATAALNFGTPRRRSSLKRLGPFCVALLISLGSVGAFAQKSGGVLKMPDFASPASMSIHEEITRAAINALMPVLYDRHDCARPRRQLVLGCRKNRADLQIAPRGQMA
jgi:hypothetical protein